MNLVVKIVVGILLVVGVSFLLSYPAMLLWNNCLVPAVFISHPVTWMQMWGISILMGLLFGKTSS